METWVVALRLVRGFLNYKSFHSFPKRSKTNNLKAEMWTSTKVLTEFLEWWAIKKWYRERWVEGWTGRWMVLKETLSSVSIRTGCPVVLHHHRNGTYLRCLPPSFSPLSAERLISTPCSGKNRLFPASLNRCARTENWGLCYFFKHRTQIRAAKLKSLRCFEPGHTRIRCVVK